MVLIAGPWTLQYYQGQWAEPAIRVGILHSLSGTMAFSERSVVDATILAVEELNEGGGLLGRKVEPVIADGKSDWPTFSREAARLIDTEKVSVLFGCWTSASRKTILPILESRNHLLFYPVQYEGLEQSPNIVYTGASPNQQIIPAVKWAFDHLGRRFFLVGSDYVFPRTANAIIRAQASALQAEIVGEEYAILGSTNMTDIVGRIAAVRPSVILNTLNGDSNLAFFRALRAAGIRPEQIPTISFSIGENEIQSMDPPSLAGDYTAWNYFQSIPGEENTRFVARFRKRFGDQRVLSDPMESAYTGVHIWARAAEEAKSDQPSRVRIFLPKQHLIAPQGNVFMDRRNQHAWKTARIGKILPSGQMEIVWTSERPIRPVPFPYLRPPAQWAQFLSALYRSWGNQWANPGKAAAHD